MFNVQSICPYVISWRLWNRYEVIVWTDINQLNSISALKQHTSQTTRYTYSAHKEGEGEMCLVSTFPEGKMKWNMYNISQQSTSLDSRRQWSQEKRGKAVYRVPLHAIMGVAAHMIENSGQDVCHRHIDHRLKQLQVAESVDWTTSKGLPITKRFPWLLLWQHWKRLKTN